MINHHRVCHCDHGCHQRTIAATFRRTMLLVFAYITPTHGRARKSPQPPAVAATDSPFIGINYGRLGDNLPTPAQVVALLKSRGLKHAKIYDADRGVLTAFKNSGITLMMQVPNEQVVAIATSQTASDAWVKDNIVEFKDGITFIDMGNEWLFDSSHDMTMLVQAMEKLYLSLQNVGLTNQIKVSTCHAFNVGGFPPSQGSFPANTVSVMTNLLSFLQRTNSVFMLNVYPFFAYVETPSIDINYTLFTLKGAGVYDDASKLEYRNLLDAMVDTAISGMKLLGYPNMPVVITETGWPNGGSSRKGVDVASAKTYNQNLIRHVLGKKGTPLRPGQSASTYIFALFNENQKNGRLDQVEKYWGNYYPNKTSIYPLRFSA